MMAWVEMELEIGKLTFSVLTCFIENSEKRSHCCTKLNYVVNNCIISLCVAR